MHQINFITLLIVFLQIFISLAFANASSKLENNLKLSKLIDLENPWGMDLIDSDNILITEKKGTLSIYNFLNKKIIEKIYFKDVFLKRQGGLLDVLYIKHNKKQFAYTCYQDLKTDLVIARHEIKNNKFFNKKIIFNSEHRSNNGVHFGCRMIDYKGSIMISLGDRGDRNNSQNSKNYPGTILKLNYQGISDVNVENWKSGIFSIGHRNPQGLMYLKEFDEVWSHEHGPKGGDEINIIKKNKNYGWPIVTYGKEYWGGKIGVNRPVEGYEEPIWKWIPSIAPSGITYYNKNSIKSFKNKILVGSLKFRSLYVIELKNKRPISEIGILKNKIGRIRDVLTHPNGYVLLISDEKNGGLFKLEKN